METLNKDVSMSKGLQHGTATRENLRCFTDRVSWKKAGCVSVCKDAAQLTAAFPFSSADAVSIVETLALNWSEMIHLSFLCREAGKSRARPFNN